MKKVLLLIIMFCATGLSFAQFTTGTVTLTTGYTVKVDTNTEIVTLTLVGPSTTWLGIGFGGNFMSTVNDFFIWNATANRDYTSTGGYITPQADATQSWTITSDNAASSVRTVIATRALVSPGDYTFTNDNASIPIIYALSNSTNLGQHQGPHSGSTLARTQLGVEDFSLNASSIYPNPSNGSFVVKTKSALDTIEVYSQTGAFVKIINVNSETNTEVNIDGLATGIYLLELRSATDKSWKKVIVK